MATTSLDFLKINGLFPPRTELNKLYNYKRYDDLFYSRVGDAYLAKLQNDKNVNEHIVKQMQTIYNNPRIMNFARAITKKTVDLALSRKPYIISTKGKTKDVDIFEIENSTEIWKKLRKCFTDVSRYGNGYIREYNKIPRYTKDNGKGKVEMTAGKPACNVINPQLVVDVLNPLNTEDVMYYVIGWIDKVETNDKSIAQQNQIIVGETSDIGYEYFLTVEIHGKGEYEYRRFKVSPPIINYSTVKQYQILEEVTSSDLKGKKFPTGLDGFAIKHFTNYSTSDDPNFGLSDYDQFDTLMVELAERVGQLSQVFTKHGEPAMQGSPNLLTNDEEGNPVFYTGEFYPREAGEEELSYITWDAKGKEILEYCNQILKNIWILTEMGDGTIMGYNNGNSGFAESGKALRMKLASPLMKIQGLILDNEDTIMQLLIDFLKISGKDVKLSDIEIKWQDGLPVDDIEEANIFQVRVSSGTESIIYGLQRRFNMTPDQAQKEFDQILKEKKMITESSFQQNSFNNQDNKQVTAKTREQIENETDGRVSGTQKLNK